MLESGDPTHLTPGTQINPPLVQLATKPIQYYAVVSDEEEMGNVYEVLCLCFPSRRFTGALQCRLSLRAALTSSIR